MSTWSTADKFYGKFLMQGSAGVYTDSGDIADLGLLDINDELLKNRIALLERPIISLEKAGLNLNNAGLEVFLLLDRVLTYYAGLFDFSDKQFNRIKGVFIRNWYFGDVYVAYGEGFLNNELSLLKKAQDARETKLLKADIFPECKFRLYSPQWHEDGKLTFTSLISGIQGHNIHPDNLVKASWGGKGLWLEWFDLAKEILALERGFVQLCKLALTKVKVGVSRAEDVESELTDILGWSFFYAQKGIGNTNDIEAMDFCDITDPQDYLHGAYLYIAQKMNRLGMVSSSEQKSERMTTGEHYKDLKFACNTELEMLSNMAGFVDELNKTFELERPLTVNLTSSLSANGAPKTQDNPFDKFKHNKFGGDDNFDKFGGGTNKQF